MKESKMLTMTIIVLAASAWVGSTAHDGNNRIIHAQYQRAEQPTETELLKQRRARWVRWSRAGAEPLTSGARNYDDAYIQAPPSAGQSLAQRRAQWLKRTRAEQPDDQQQSDDQWKRKREQWRKASRV
jgi:hypothetical protein